MGNISREYAKDLKALIYDLDERASKQVLYGCVEILTQHPSILKDVFVMLVSDGRDLVKWNKKEARP